MSHTLCTAVFSKVHEQIEKTDHLIDLVPESRIGLAAGHSWRFFGRGGTRAPARMPFRILCRSSCRRA